MKNWPKVKSILTEARSTLKKEWQRYLVFSLPISLLSLLFVLAQIFISPQQIFLNILIIIGLLIVSIFPRIGLILFIGSNQRSEKYSIKKTVSSIKSHWKRALGAYVLYWTIILAVIFFGTSIVGRAYMVPALIILGTIGIYAFAIWLGIRMVFMRYIAIFAPSKPLVATSFTLTKGWFWTLLRTNINTYSGWILLFGAIRYGISALGYTDLVNIISWVGPLFLIILEPYRTASEIILFRQCKESNVEKESIELVK